MLWDHRERSPNSSIDRSLDRLVVRLPIARSLDQSLDRSLDRSIVRRPIPLTTFENVFFGRGEGEGGVYHNVVFRHDISCQFLSNVIFGRVLLTVNGLSFLFVTLPSTFF